MLLNTHILLNKFINSCLQNKYVFTAYRLPGRNELSCLTNHSDTAVVTGDIAEIFTQKGFVFAPFQASSHSPVCFIPATNQFQLPVPDEDIPFSFTHLLDDTLPFSGFSEEEYLRKTNQLIQAIQSDDELSKVVMSRIQPFTVDSVDQVVRLFISAAHRYPNAFVYIYYSVQTGFWLGATPEKLLTIADGKGQAVSLAGTRPLNQDVAWTQKEEEEQAIVTRYIEDALTSSGIQNYTRKGPLTEPAGNVVHLKTKFDFDVNSKTRIDQLIAQLHPNPAICGMPRQKALSLINSTEEYNRAYYAGFLGPIEGVEQMDLYINLRCMQLNGKQGAAYVGGGITADSVAEHEWAETVLKSRTLLDLLSTENE